mgnify:CR=1 FL=1
MGTRWLKTSYKINCDNIQHQEVMSWINKLLQKLD